jgi:hypothetical protein
MSVFATFIPVKPWDPVDHVYGQVHWYMLHELISTFRIYIWFDLEILIYTLLCLFYVSSRWFLITSPTRQYPQMVVSPDVEGVARARAFANKLLDA